MKKATFHIQIIVLLGLLSIAQSCGVRKSLNDKPEVSQYNQHIPERKKIAKNTYFAGKNFLTKNKYGLWELYVAGDPLERGLLTGSLTQELFHYQENVFFSKVEDFVPSKTKQYLLRKFLAWYNRKMYRYVKEEYKTEIYGLSKYASSDYNNIAPPYLRMLYLHAAHDIGHALQDLALVGCSSFACWGEHTLDGQLLLGRNFDFYVNDAFAKNKIIAFIKPTTGYPFMSVTWGGMIGVLSGMNNQGLTVTINAGKSNIPLEAKNPISLVTREILQYASTTQEAIAIAKKQKVFVSESIMVGSAKDKKAILIEISPDKFGVYQVGNSSKLICTNHFQSKAYANDKNNNEQIENSHSLYRYQRLEELLNEKDQLTPQKAVSILRNRKGLHDKAIGYGNEKALNQLLAHHGIVFKPEENKVWVSANPYQLGAFVAYDLDAIFSPSGPPALTNGSIAIDSLTIAEDPFVHSKAFANYQNYRKLERKVEKTIKKHGHLSPGFIHDFQQKNPDYWKAYALIGKYYKQQGYNAAAVLQFKKALTKEITTKPDKEEIEQYLRKLKQ